MNAPTTDTSLFPELQTRREQFEALKREAEALTEGLSETVFNRAPAPGAWSVGECLDHLNAIGTQLLPRLKEAIRETEESGHYASGPFHYGPMERLFIRLNGPNPPFKMPTVGAYRPAEATLDPEQVTGEFLSLQDQLIDCVEAANGLDLTTVTIPSPANRWVRLSLGAWLALTAAHEERHIEQARRTLDVTRRPPVSNS